MWATEYLQMKTAEARTKTAWTLRPSDWAAQGSNVIDRLTGNTAKIPGLRHAVPAGLLALGAGGTLVGMLGHRSGHRAVRRTLEDAGSTPEDLARADYLAKRPRSGYGLGGALTAGLAGVGAGFGTNMALQKATGMLPGKARLLGLGAGLAAAYGAAKYRSEADERERLKGLS